MHHESPARHVRRGKKGRSRAATRKHPRDIEAAVRGRRRPARNSKQTNHAPQVDLSALEPAKRSKGGRPPIDIDPEKVEELARLECTDEEIALFLGCGETTLQRRFGALLKKGRAHLRQSLRRAQIKSAIQDGNPTMLIWLGKVLLGQREAIDHSIQANVNVKPRPIVFNVVPSAKREENA